MVIRFDRAAGGVNSDFGNATRFKSPLRFDGAANGILFDDGTCSPADFGVRAAGDLVTGVGGTMVVRTCDGSFGIDWLRDCGGEACFGADTLGTDLGLGFGILIRGADRVTEGELGAVRTTGAGEDRVAAGADRDAAGTDRLTAAGADADRPGERLEFEERSRAIAVVVTTAERATLQNNDLNMASSLRFQCND